MHSRADGTLPLALPSLCRLVLPLRDHIAIKAITAGREEQLDTQVRVQ